jgi:HEAT repeat protein
VARTRDEAQILCAIESLKTLEPETLDDADYGRVCEWVNHPNPSVRKAAVEALEEFYLDWAPAPVALARFAIESDVEVRAQLISTLALLGCDALEEAEIVAMKEGPRDPDYDRDAPEWYLHFRDQIQALAENEAEAEPVRAAAISALGELSTDPRFQDTWLPFLENPSPVLRAAALKAVSYSSDATGAEDAILAGLDDPDSLVRKWSILAAGNTHFEAAAERIRPLLDSDDPEVQGDAWYAFAGCAPLEEARALIARLGHEVVEGDPRFECYDAARGLLQQRLPPSSAQERHGERAEAPPKGEPVRRATPKVGRNEPCPCGSGKKYKKCCGM